MNPALTPFLGIMMSPDLNPSCNDEGNYFMFTQSPEYIKVQVLFEQAVESANEDRLVVSNSKYLGLGAKPIVVLSISAKYKNYSIRKINI